MAPFCVSVERGAVGLEQGWGGKAKEPWPGGLHLLHEEGKETFLRVGGHDS